MARTILVVDDEPTLRETLVDALEADGFRVVSAADGREALTRFRAERPDLVLLDLMLPELSGIEVCRIIRAESGVPIVMLTAKDSELDKVVGLELGADDYVTKPFSLRELTARVRAVLRRSAAKDDHPLVTYRGDHLVADFEAVTVVVDSETVRLTRREFELLRYLVQNKNRVVSRDRLLERVWGYERLVETRSVDVHVGRLRTKLRTAGRQIETVIGLGYRFVD
jgi:DNA-binding response OmpR family regulator